MNILLVNPLLPYVRGGAEVNDLNLGKAFKDLGHEVAYLTSEDQARAIYPMPKWSKVVRVSMERLSCEYIAQKGFKGKLFRYFYFYKFAKEASVKGHEILEWADIVLLTGRPVMLNIRKATKAPVVHSIRGWAGWLNIFYLRKASGFIFWGGCESDNVDFLKRSKPWLPCDPSVEEAIFFPGEPSEKLKLKMKEEDPNGIVLTYVGRMEPIQQVDYLIRAASRARCAGHNIYLSLVGGGSELNNLTALAEKVLPGRVIFHGRQTREKVGEILRASDIFILYPRIENHPISLKEAISCGVYVIAPDLGRISRMVSGQDVGKVILPQNQESLDFALQRVLESQIYKNKTRTLSEVGFSTWENSAKSIITWSKRNFSKGDF